MLAEGEVDVSPMVMGTVGLSGVEGAFDALGDPEIHAKIVIDPKRSSSELVVVGLDRTARAGPQT